MKVTANEEWRYNLSMKMGQQGAGNMDHGSLNNR